ncbi:MAG: succinylglutamate-semialdehyde dehydrogenase [Alphaproteobacteria bacterium]|nr:succinylglutamate-semialdehyde dehydrogenase [Alphaproteobacteria bacterium]
MTNTDLKPQLWIGGAWRMGGGDAFASRDPAHGDVVWRGAAANADDVDAAMTAARAAFPAWARLPLEERIAIARAFAARLTAHGDAFVRTIARETGKPLWDAKGEHAAMVGKIEISIRAQAERAGARAEAAAFGAAELAHRPHGVLSVFGPFNFPGHLPNGHIVPALLAGNVVVFKPSELTPGVAALMCAAWEEAGLPAGVINLVQGGRETGAALLAHDALSGVLFTGSATTGAYIHKLFAGRPDVLLALEMGGNNPLIVWPGAAPGIAANLAAHSAYSSSGQRCTCARRLIVPDDAFGEAVITELVAIARRIVVGPWDATPEPFMGPLVREDAARRAEVFAADLVARGGRVIEPLAREGAFVRPGLIDMTGAEAADEELFGPLLQVFRVRTIDDAIARANATRFGLSAGLISDDAALWERVRIEVRAGVLNWNRPTPGASSAMPFGGPGLSGNLRPSAYYAADYVAYPVASQIATAPAPLTAPGFPA